MFLKAIETKYKGYRFRSRLEARWAVFFDTLGLKWDYEFEGFDLGEAGWYLPDFWFPNLNCWVEIKPTTPTKDERNKAQELCRLSKRRVFIVIGVPDIDEYGLIDGEGFHWWHVDEDEIPYLKRELECTECPTVKKLLLKQIEDSGFVMSPEPMSFSAIFGRIEPSVLDSAIAAARSARFERGR